MAKTADAEQTLGQHLAERIRRNGPMTFHDWMEAALYDEERGYYRREDLERWGREGDYRTAPETSVLFAATFARYFATLFQNAQEDLTVVEVGAGAGHFAAGLLDTLSRRHPSLFHRITYLIDEINQHARARIALRTAKFAPQIQFKRLSEIDSLNPGIIFANEVLDAFPVHRVVMRDGKLRELYVELNVDHSFSWREGPISTDEILVYLNNFEIYLREGQIVEINTRVKQWFSQISEKLKQGYIVVVDYGSEAAELYGNESRTEGTLRSFQRHKLTPHVLESPGLQDITSTVDWTAAMVIASEQGFELVRFERLDQFLMKERLLEELELRVTEADDESEGVRLRTSAREMILPTRMAGSFQVLVWKR